MTAIIILGGIVLAVFIMCVFQYLETRRNQGEDLDWYTDNGKSFMRDGQVICMACKSTHIGAKRVAGPLHLRRGYCLNCGLELFYTSVGQIDRAAGGRHAGDRESTQVAQAIQG